MINPHLSVFLCFLATLCEGIDLQTAGVAAAGIRQQFHPDSQLLSYFFSAGTFGLFIGAIVGGRLADRIGRKRVLVSSIIVFGLCSLITVWAWDIPSLIATRLATGLGLGGALPNLISIGSENAAPHRRNASVAMIYSGTPLGGALASVVSLLVPTAHWKTIFVVGGLLPLIVAPIITAYLRESEAFSRLRSDTALAGAERPGLFAFLEQGRAGRTFLLWASFLLSLLTLYLLLNWLPTLLASNGSSRTQVAISMIGFNTGGFLSTVYIGIYLETRLRRGGVLATFVGMPLLLLLLAHSTGQGVPVSLIIAALGAAVVASQGILYSYAPQIYPTRNRGTGVGFAVGMGRIGSIIGPVFGGSLVGSGLSASAVLTGLLPVVCVGSVCAISLAWRQPPVQPD
jgi:AAHS family 3-hydroxyphenylpropionic acid transporter